MKLGYLSVKIIINYQWEALPMIFANKHTNFTSAYHVNRFFVVKALVFCEDRLTSLVSAAAHYRETLTKLGWQRM